MSVDFKQIGGIEKWMGYVAVLVATIAAFAALYEARLNRQHQAISVWPYLQMWAAVSFSVDPEQNEDAFSFNIANKGVGPAIINDLKLIYRGKEYPR